MSPCYLHGTVKALVRPFLLLLLLSLSPLSSGYMRMGYKQDEFAFTTSELRMQILEDMISDTPMHNYTQQDLDLLFGVYRKLGVLVAFEKEASGRPFLTHAIGTASCALRFGLPPLYAAAMMGHGTYTKKWVTANDFWKKEMDVCELRRVVSAFSSVELERIIYMWTMLHYNGEESHEIWRELYNKLQNDINAVDQEIKNLLVMSICDTIETHQNGEQWWSYGEKKNTGKNGHHDMVRIIGLLLGGKYSSIVSNAFHTTAELYSERLSSTSAHHAKSVDAIRMLSIAATGSSYIKERAVECNSHFDVQRDWIKSNPISFASNFATVKSNIDGRCDLQSMTRDDLVEYVNKVQPLLNFSDVRSARILSLN